MTIFIDILVYFSLITNILLTIFVYRKFKTIILTIPSWAIFYWSIYGALDVIILKEKSLTHYIEQEMFSVSIDYNYVYSILLYCIFLWIFNTIIFSYTYFENTDKNKINNIFPIQFNKEPLYIFLTVLFCIYFLGWKDDILIAYDTGQSLYSISRFQSGLKNYYSLYQFIGDLFFSLSIISMILLKRTTLKEEWYLFILNGSFFILQLMLGNRSLLLVGFMLYMMLYIELYGIKKALKIKKIVLLFFLFGGISLIGFVREVPITEMWNLIINYNLEDLLNVYSVLSNSVEKLAAHLSMYGVINQDVPLTYGSSILFLISSLIPTFLDIPRFPDIYSYYATYMGFIGNKGFTINHITAWYLNFGILGIVIGSLFWAMILLFLYKKYVKSKSLHWLIFASLFSVSSIQMIRAGGIESYKGGLLLFSFIPAVIILFLKNISKFKFKI